MGILQVKMMMVLTALFALLYAVMTIIGTAAGVTNFYFYLILSAGMMFLQYLIGPSIVEWSMRVKYIDRKEAPELFRMVEEQAHQAGIPMPRVGISELNIANAFAFGRGVQDGRVCVTEGIRRLLKPDELRAVIGHELSHIKNRDVLTITVLSVVPMIMYRLAWQMMFFGSGRRHERGGNSGAFIGMAAFLFYFITNLLVLYASRIREYFADKGSVELGNQPASLASALYKLVYGSARMPKDELSEAEGMKAFFLNDPTQARDELRDLKALDLNKDGSIDAQELERLREKKAVVGGSERLMEILSTHPNMLKRIQHLSHL